MYARQPGDIEPDEIGQIELARFVNPQGLRAIGKNLFLETPASGFPILGEPGEGRDWHPSPRSVGDVERSGGGGDGGNDSFSASLRG